MRAISDIISPPMHQDVAMSIWWGNDSLEQKKHIKSRSSAIALWANSRQAGQDHRPGGIVVHALEMLAEICAYLPVTEIQWALPVLRM